MVSVERVPGGAADDERLVAGLTALVNTVYAEAEDGIWREGAQRTTASEIAGLIADGEIAVRRLADGSVAGAVRVQRLGEGLGEFGMLACDPRLRGSGIGRELVDFAESWCAGQGASAMQLELLVPRTWVHPMKDFLDRWYTRLGYRVVRRGSLEESYPHLVADLATPCDFLIYRKPLSAGS
ncbi:GNAT family N-acetyltransferase [Nocardia transvalensis]|uniref:GNAT family N-acetyltransferase n=1 Tax=Nocardia transvalensis TaxID=37333 RepID=UPI0018953060|nr:GNAT family N-acetyltransferase [Nocardia transvalensis]MBF6332028.1 GNAT family N-acetyltransferase [Nocardia transvalensis]